MLRQSLRSWCVACGIKAFSVALPVACFQPASTVHARLRPCLLFPIVCAAVNTQGGVGGSSEHEEEDGGAGMSAPAAARLPTRA